MYATMRPVVGIKTLNMLKIHTASVEISSAHYYHLTPRKYSVLSPKKPFKKHLEVHGSGGSFEDGIYTHVG